jgi:hypothetical protein
MDEDEVVTNYFYDLAYYEGIRNTLMIINKNLMVPGSKKENINQLLKEIREELDDAHRMHKESENDFLKSQSDDFY